MTEHSQDLHGKVAVVTGGSGAIGAAILASFRRSGATGVALDVAAPAADVGFVSCDIRQESSVTSAIGEVMSRHGRIDIAVHAAGISRDAVVWKLTADEWDQVQSVNLRGAFLLIRSVVPIMRQERTGGRIVLIGSINGSRGKFGTAAYSASKAGLLGLAKSVARETGKFGVLVNVIEPGWVRTPLTEKVPQEIKDAALAESLVGSFLDPEDVASAVTFLCGQGGRRITGQLLRVDGGQFLGPH